MNKFFKITILLLPFLVKAQDTIYVSHKNTSYITFPEDISYFDIGLPENYVADIGQGVSAQSELKENFDGKMLKLKCIRPTEDISSLMIKFGDKYELINLKYKAVPSKLFYSMYKDLNSNSLNKNSSNTVITKQNSSNSLALNTNTVIARERIKLLCDSVLKMKNELKEYGFIDTYLQAGVTVIRNDDNQTYLKIAIQNKSSIPYKFDFISFQYVQKMNKGIGKSKKKAPTDVFPIETPVITEVPPNSGRYATYAIPTFRLANNGFLLVLFREKQGDRVLKIEIPSNVVQGSSYIK